MADGTKTLGQGAKLLVDIGPAAVFMISYSVFKRFTDDTAIFWATGLFMAATAFALGWAYFVQKRFPPMLVVTFAIVTVFGAITLYLQDPIFIYIKPTIINLLFSFTILLCFAFGFNVWKYLFNSIYQMPERIWVILGIRWALLFMLLAVVNEILWRHIGDSVVPETVRLFENFTITEGFWVRSKFIITYPLFLVFVLANVPITLKHAKAPETDGESQS